MRQAQGAPLGIGHPNGIARLRAGTIHNVRSEQPRMPRRRPFSSLPGNANRVHSYAARPPRRLSSRAMRCSVAGCVENRFAKLARVKGLMMYICDVTGDASIGIRFE